MNFEEIEKKVIDWAEERGIYDIDNGSSPHAQLKKLTEELTELYEGIYECDNFKAKDSIGDMMVVLTHIAKFIGSDMTECYDLAYDQIKDRRGKMVNGIFVKEQ